ncbi:MAG: PQQ-dependent sugar dehydrogenase [Pirellulales bacterium]|nr:PQQ-dependent sugar dehydrogenase [Pirellulales bacterium]
MSSNHWGRGLAASVISFAIACIGQFPAYGQDLLNDNIPFAAYNLKLRPYVTMPNGQRNIISMTTRPDDDRLYVTTQEGKIFAVEENAQGQTQLVEWFNMRAAVQAATGRDLNYQNFAHGGLRNVSFHPEFATNGKFYTSAMENRPANTAGHNYLGNSVSNVAADSAVVEWTYNHQTGQVVTNSYRELFRVNMPVYDHPVKQMKFNKHAVPGDEDYGKLYITHGDASVQSATAGGGQNRNDALGKVLRIDPLQAGNQRYTTPGNPFNNDPSTLDEIYALGFRNPHNLAFAKDATNQSKLIVVDIGRDNMEEVNLIEAGGNYGWSNREGTFVHLPGGGYINGVAPLPANEASLGYIYPAAQFDHDAITGQGFVGVAVAGSHVIANGSDPNLQGQYIFGDFGQTGKIYTAKFDDMLDAVTKLDPLDPTRDHPSELTQAPISQLRLEFDHDNNPLTPALLHDTFTSLIGNSRTDLRFGEGDAGELYLSSKRNGTIYLATNTVPEPSALALVAFALCAGTVARKSWLKK